MPPPQADPAYSTPSALQDERGAAPGYPVPAAREERPTRQASPYGQAALPPAVATPARQPVQEEEEEDEANSYDSDEASKLLQVKGWGGALFASSRII